MIDAYSSDITLMQELGLRVEDFGFDWTDLGTVSIHGFATVRVEVAAAPAQFWRFTVTRKNEETREPETITVLTGSGAFADYWPTAKLVAEGMLEIR